MLQSFFKTKPGDYGDGELFYGVQMPELRKLLGDHMEYFLNMPLSEQINGWLLSDYHEEKMLGCLAFVKKYENSKKLLDAKLTFKIVLEYLSCCELLCNWDFVDCSAHYILGDYMLNDSDDTILLTALVSDGWKDCVKSLASRYHIKVSAFDIDNVTLTEGKSKSLGVWPRRIAIVSTWALIKTGRFNEILMLAGSVLDQINVDKTPYGRAGNHDLIHKATGWMLREVWKQKKTVLEQFLDKNAEKMPKVMLRYAIEKMTATKRKSYMSKRLI